MTLTQAVKSGLPVRRKSWNTNFLPVSNNSVKGRELSDEDINADDWETGKVNLIITTVQLDFL